MSAYSGPMVANSFQAGATCPFCQESIVDNQTVVKCNQCGSLHHDLCWHHNSGCASYHCDQKVRQDVERQPELTITGDDLVGVIVPPKPARRVGAEAAKAFLPTPPRRLSLLAIISLLLTFISMGGFFGVFKQSMPIALLGIAVCLVALALGIVAMVIINTGRKRHGMFYAGSAVMMASLLVVGYIVSLHSTMSRNFAQHRINLQIDESRPTEESLARLAPERARALRANVVITNKGGSLFGQMRLGSGIVVRKENNRTWILTNRHVIGADTGDDLSQAGQGSEVLFYNGERSNLTVEWLAPADVDLAIVSCQALTIELIEPVPVSAEVCGQGEMVFAVGNPEGLLWTYTEGVISSVRTRQMDGRQIEIYQTQTPINSGNSGGGLYTRSGQLVGINTWTSDKSVSEGLSFAISSRAFLELLGEDGRRKFLQPPADLRATAAAAADDTAAEDSPAHDSEAPERDPQ